MNKVLSIALRNCNIFLLLLLSSSTTTTTTTVNAWLSSCPSVVEVRQKSSMMIMMLSLRAPPSFVRVVARQPPAWKSIDTATLSPSSSSSMTMLRDSSRPDNDSLDNDDNSNYDDMDDDDNNNDELCADEEECEIDWDAMPLDETASSSSASARTRLEMQWELAQAAEDCDVEVPTSCGSEPCEECAGRGNKPCRFCHGTAVLYMQRQPPPTASARYDVAFAATSRYGMPTAAAAVEQTFEFSACPICQNGNEVCRSCQGTGWVATWTHWQDPAH